MEPLAGYPWALGGAANHEPVTGLRFILEKQPLYIKIPALQHSPDQYQSLLNITR
jgi:hypothetical protein